MKILSRLARNLIFSGVPRQPQVRSKKKRRVFDNGARLFSPCSNLFFVLFSFYAGKSSWTPRRSSAKRRNFSRNLPIAVSSQVEVDRLSRETPSREIIGNARKVAKSSLRLCTAYIFEIVGPLSIVLRVATIFYEIKCKKHVSW